MTYPTVPTYSKSQCYRKREHDKKEMCRKYCPLIRRLCRADCACFELGTWTQAVGKEGRYYYHVGFCRSPLITGDITAENGITINY